MQRKQTTSCEDGGYPPEVGVEPRGNAGALSISPASERRRDDKPEDKEELLERILEQGESESGL